MLAAPAPAPPRRTPLASRVLRGPAGDPAWTRPALLVLLVATALLYLWGLGASGWANSFYSAAAQAGSASWKAFFYGSSDASNAITVDKPPASLWVMALSVRVFGLSSWSILVPQALMGVGSVALLYATVRRWSGPVAGLLAGAILATTPVAVLMFRFNNPDALLVLLMVAGAYATVRAIETASTRWLVLTGVLVGFGFLTKMLQALLVVPAFALAYLVAAPTPLRRRITQVLWGGLAMVVAAGWWVAIVELVPARYRPYVGGSQDNSILELTLGYNGLGRLNGDETGSVGGGQGGGWGQTGLTRLFDAENGGQVAWLLPAALMLLITAFALLHRRPVPRAGGLSASEANAGGLSASEADAGKLGTDRTRASLILWGGWLLVTGLVFSLMQGIFHAYYNVALAPAVGAVVAVGAAVLWRERTNPAVAAILAGTTAITALWAWVLLGRSADWHPWLRAAVLVLGLASAAAFLLAGRLARWAVSLVAAAAVGAGLLGPVGYALSTASTPHTGAIPTAGPAVAGGRGFGPGGGGGPGGGAPGGGGFRGGLPGGGGPGGAQGVPGGGQAFGAPGGTRGGGMGGLLDATTPDAELAAALSEDAGSYTWVAATVGANNAAGYQLATELPVMAIGGFNGSDPSPTLEQFQRYVAEGKVHYFLGGAGLGRSNGGSDAAQEIAAWVADNFTATTVGGVTLYDLS
ncbi:hypothetical protein Psuf_047860 [Phytohabitans suffuscus]|uniref:Uncharacterized protein n=1 Tax=Phytohabitans suffuscus TaxID=624315 RepID=A0A6F8YN54_9ACTN|nr:hypothetical protein Psuf_047860 [Phytohabitans suffuscus]